MQEDQSLIQAEYICCQYREEISAYYCQLLLNNRTSHTVYFNIVSTFGKYLKQLTGVTQVSAKQSVTLKISFIRTNIIHQKNEKISISYSRQKISLLTHVEDSHQQIVPLQFNDEFVNDEEIQMILASECMIICEQGKKLEWNGQFEKAKYKYQQAFVIIELFQQMMRSRQQSLLGLVSCSVKMGQHLQALKNLDCLLINKKNTLDLLFLKIKILFDFYQGNKSKNDFGILYYCKKTIFRLIASQDKSLAASELQNFSERLQKYAQKQRDEKLIMLKDHLFEKALKNYSTNNTISRFYRSSQEFKKDLDNILEFKGCGFSAYETPEEVLDPISYEIISDPVILPSGISFDKKSIELYFKTNGCKDPFTRVHLDPKWIQANLSLKDYILSNPKLSDWRKYEYQMIHY